MSVWWIIGIVLLGIFMLGPLMYAVCKLNDINPYILEDEYPEEDEKSYITVMVFRPLFIPLWLETKAIQWIKTKCCTKEKHIK